MKNVHAIALGRLGGKAKSDRKAEAARKNGKLGGAPKGNQNWMGKELRDHAVKNLANPSPVNYTVKN